jgi:hypothetical protein
LHLNYSQDVSNKQIYSWFQIFAVFWNLYIFFWVFPRKKTYKQLHHHDIIYGHLFIQSM